MAKVEIYTTPTCPFCVRAKALLKSKNVDFTEIDVLSDFKVKTAMIKRTQGARSVPQIFIDNEHIGGCDDLYALEAKKALDVLLN
ncbi:MAG: glutaredoxin 3 [OCS116 cluster bacterium]|uniref:Glutaredoxin n=1 Tax=OCS116 cluster bacterium TaxID=2030921 RepID=A0A2A4Z4H6_9PROT|nr:glutaredoxin 3 [OCS116 cluster bacterium]